MFRINGVYPQNVIFAFDAMAIENDSKKFVAHPKPILNPKSPDGMPFGRCYTCMPSHPNAWVDGFYSCPFGGSLSRKIHKYTVGILDVSSCAC